MEQPLPLSIPRTRSGSLRKAEGGHYIRNLAESVCATIVIHSSQFCHRLMSGYARVAEAHVEVVVLIFEICSKDTGVI